MAIENSYDARKLAIKKQKSGHHKFIKNYLFI